MSAWAAIAGKTEVDCTGKIVLPGFLDAHIHLESSLVSPTEFVKAVLPHGTTTVVTDPMRSQMLWEPTESSICSRPQRACRWMCGSCYPPVSRQRRWTNPVILDYRAIDSFYDHPRVQGLAELMNFVGAINGDEQTVEKIVAAQAHHKKIDGHART
ncbi:MAG: amidohydrolase family protein [Oscillospiraceae bacterium]